VDVTLLEDIIPIVIGAAASALLIPYFTSIGQTHQKGLEIKVDLIQRISNNVMSIMTLIESLSGLEDDKELELEKKIRVFKVKNKVIDTELEGYYPLKKKENTEPANMRDEWEKLRRDILDYGGRNVNEKDYSIPLLVAKFCCTEPACNVFG